jgi:lysophospholipase L1-like esterase
LRKIAAIMVGFFGVCVVAQGALLAQGLHPNAGSGESRTEEIEWTWEVRPEHANAALPNILLLGDSITRAYFPEVKKELEGVANVYLMSSSTSLGDARIEPQIEEFARAEGVRFKVVHFNNGMHGWSYSEAEYGAAFPGFLAVIRKVAPGAGLIWASTTPVRKDAEPNAEKPGATNARVDARNAVAAGVMKSAGIVVDDQHGLMSGHGDLHSDDVHFNDTGAALEGKQAAGLIRGLLGAGR